MADSSNKLTPLDVAKDAYSEGASDVEIAKLLGVTIARFYQMYEEIPEFAKFVEHGRTLSQAWWYEKARKNLWNKDFNHGLWYQNMKNRYGWADKVDTADKTNVEDINADEIKGKIAATIKKLARTNPELLRSLDVNGDSDPA